MRDELLDYYEQELTYLRQIGAEFAEKYPKIAARLELGPNYADDPHAERMIEAFAFLAARVHLKIDDEFPQITQALFNSLYPHFIRPIPAMTTVEFTLDKEQGKLSTGYEIKRGTMLYSDPVEGVPLKFEVCYDTVLWPVDLEEAEWTAPERLNPPMRAPGAVAALRLRLETPADMPLQAIEMDTLRFHLHGGGSLPYTLYELLSNNCVGIKIRVPKGRGKPRTEDVPLKNLQPVGFADDESMLPYLRRSFRGYRLLQEYFAFPEKFLYFDLKGLAEVWQQGFGSSAEIIFLISQFERSERQEQVIERAISPDTFRLRCAPVVNLFKQTAEPIQLNQRRYEYPIVPDVRRRRYLEVFQVNDVVATRPSSREVVQFEPFYSHTHAKRRETGECFWHTTRRPSTQPGDLGTEVDITLVDMRGRPMHPDADTVTVRTLCTNRDLANQVTFGDPTGDFEIEGAAAIDKITSLRKPTLTLRPPLGRDAFWPLVSHLSLNYLSVVEEGKEALQEILRLYNYSKEVYVERQIQAITELSSRRHFARVMSENGVSLVRGTRVEMTIDEDPFDGSGVYLMGAVLERFLGLYVSLNSFSQLVVNTKQRKEVMREWDPRAGEVILL